MKTTHSIVTTHGALLSILLASAVLSSYWPEHLRQTAELWQVTGAGPNLDVDRIITENRYRIILNDLRKMFDSES
jgi:hypothetical protein